MLIAILPMVGSACKLDSQGNYRHHQVSKDYDEANEEGSTTHSSFQVEYEAVMPILKANTAPLIFLIIQLNLVKEISHPHYDDNSSENRSFLRILFRRIISPNGP